MPMRRLIPLLAALALLAVVPAPALAQNPLAVVAEVDDRIVTRHELQQRALLLELFNTPGDLQAQALETLIDERLQLAEARRMGIRLAPADIRAGLEEFAGRFELSPEEFVALVGEAGVAVEALRDFVEAGLAWRRVLEQRFAGRINIPDTDLERAMAVTAQRGELRVLLSELVLPATEDNLELAELLSRTATPAEFEEAAQLYSIAPTRPEGGRLNWVTQANLPDRIRSVIAGLQPGQVSPPIPVEGAILLLLLRNTDRSLNLPPSAIRVEYGRALLPPDRAGADLVRLRAGADSCPDFLRILGHLPEAVTAVETSTLAALPAAVSGRIARLDAGEIAAETRADGAVEVLMLCRRTPGTAEEGPDTNAARAMLNDVRLSQMADGLLAELRAAAVIRRR